MNYKYDGQIDPRIHIENCVQAWKHTNDDERVHMFVRTLDIIPNNWYTETELHRGIESCVDESKNLSQQRGSLPILQVPIRLMNVWYGRPDGVMDPLPF